MDKELNKKIALLAEIAKQNRIIELRLKQDKIKNEQIKREIWKMIKNLSK